MLSLAALAAVIAFSTTPAHAFGLNELPTNAGVEEHEVETPISETLRARFIDSCRYQRRHNTATTENFVVIEYPVNGGVTELRLRCPITRIIDGKI